MDLTQLFELVSEAFWIVPFCFMGVFYFLEEKARKENLQNKVHTILEKGICRDCTSTQENGNECVTALKVLILKDENKKVFQLFQRYPRIVGYLSLLQLRRIALFVASAVVLFLSMYLLKHIPKEVLPSATVESIQAGMSALGLLSLCLFAIIMWYKRFVPIRAFCDELEKIGN